MALWTGATVSDVGTQVSQLALPLAALTALHSGSLGVGALRALETVPYLLIGLPAGVWVEHRRRRPILMGADALRMVVIGSVPVAYALGHLTLAQLYVVALLAGVGSVLFDLAYWSYLPRVLTPEELLDGNAKLSVSQSVAQVGGPGVAGLLIGALGPAPAVAVDAASFVASALGVSAMRGTEPPPPARRPGDTTLALVGAGLRYVARQPILRWLTACTTFTNLGISMLETVLVVFLARTLHLGAGDIGLVFVIGGTGVVVAAFLATRITRLLGYGPTMIGALTLATAGAALAPLAPGDHGGMWLVAASQWLAQVGVTVYSIGQLTLRQAVCPDSLQSRMNATVRFLAWGIIPVGNLAGGILGAVLGLRGALWVSVAVGVASLPWLLPRSIRSVRQLPDRGHDPDPGDAGEERGDGDQRPAAGCAAVSPP